MRDVAARVQDATSELASASRSSATWTASDRASVLGAVRAAQAALAEAQGFVLVADRAAGDTMRPGDRTFEAAHARVSRSGLGEAARAVRQADALVSMGTVAAGVRDGSVPLGHLDALARVAASSTPEVAAVLRTPQAQETVVAMARSQSGPDFARALARFVAAKDPAGLQASHDEQQRERFFSMSAQPHGVFLKGRLDRVAGETLRIALDAMGQFGDDTRSPGQACADALTMLAEKVCAGSTPRRVVGESGAHSAGPVAHGSTATVGPLVDSGTDLACENSAATLVSGTVSRPHLSLLVPAETVAELIAHQRALDAETMAQDDRGGTGLVCAPIALPWAPVVPATLEDGTPVALSELARALCDAEITRIVMSAESLPLDVGRTKRLFTTAQRRAVVARDGQCVWNGCDQHASRCEVHHVRWWDRDTGPTSVTNAALLCKHHHSETHRLDLSIQRLEKPPGWTRRQLARASAMEGTDTGGTGPTGVIGEPVESITGREPLRYVFRNGRGHIINSPSSGSGVP